jgi:hemerythrin-like metal-binding protein
MQNTALDRTPLQWSPELGLGMPLMDDTHADCIALLAKVTQAPDDMLLSYWALLIDHTQEHFDREDDWMARTGFVAGNCHATQHDVILQVMREGGKRGLTGELDLVRQMAYELGLWLVSHINSMDAALAEHLRSVGFDPATGHMANPQALGAEATQSCSDSGCGTTAPSPEHTANA